jgi:uncharacterized membrane protein YphA (DoxX/SURF4 family)
MIQRVGRFFFAVSMVAFGIQHVVNGGFIVGLEFVPAWIPGHTFWAYFTAAALIYAGVSIAIEKKARPAAVLLGIAFFLSVLVRRAPSIVAILHDVGERTMAFETLAMCGGALVLAGVLPREPANLEGWNAAAEKVAAPGRYFIGISMAIFGVDHLMVPGLIAGLIPAWIPWHWFWVYFTAAGFIAAAVSFAAGKHVPLAGTLLGLMFVLWVVLVHAPRVAASPHNGDEWNSAFVALTMSRCALIVARAPDQKLGPMNCQSHMIRPSTHILIAGIVASAWPHSMAQTFSVGIVAGVSATSGFPNQTIVYSTPTTLYSEYSSHAGDYLVGVMAEVQPALESLCRSGRHLSSVELQGRYIQRPTGYQPWQYSSELEFPRSSEAPVSECRVFATPHHAAVGSWPIVSSQCKSKRYRTFELRSYGSGRSRNPSP